MAVDGILPCASVPVIAMFPLWPDGRFTRLPSAMVPSWQDMHMRVFACTAYPGADPLTGLSGMMFSAFSTSLAYTVYGPVGSALFQSGASALALCGVWQKTHTSVVPPE